MQKEECIELVKSFIAEKLNGNIWNFLNYDLALLENDEKYGGYDPDNSKIANAIYVLLWGDEVPNLTFDELGKSYRGDTLNSFHTLMGHPTEDFTNFLGIQKYTDNEKIIAMAKEFHKKYHTIGNMMVLPNNSLEVNGKNYTLNTARSLSPWYDYFDKFLLEVKQALTNPNLIFDEKSTKFLIERLVGENSDFFEKYFQLGTMEKFEDFIRTFYLEKYADTTTLEIPQIFSPHAYHWNNTYSKEEYEQYVISYIRKATEIIEYRCSRMIEDLNTILKEDSSSSETFNFKKNLKKCDKKNSIKNFFCKSISFLSTFTNEKFSYVLLFIASAMIGLSAVSIYIRFLLNDGYNTLPSESLNWHYDNGITYILFLSVFFISVSYRKTHMGIKKILMTFFVTFQLVLLAFPCVFYVVMEIVGNSKWLITAIPNTIDIVESTKDILYSIYGLILSIGVIIPCFMFLLEEKYRKFVKYWGIIFLTFLFGIPAIFSILSYKIPVILCGILIIGFLLAMVLDDLHYAIKTRCPACKKYSGLKYINTQLLNEERISIKVENAEKDRNGNIIGTYEQYIPGKRKIFLETYKCKYCGHVQTKTVTKELTSL